MNDINFGQGTHPGLVRKDNEDSYVCLPEIGLWVIADGMGGHAAGEVASGIAVREIARSIEQGMSLTEAIETAHRSIQAAARQGRGSQDMGSTVVALNIEGSRYEIAWVGDSRGYLWNGKLHRLTRDHSYIQLLIDTGVLSEEQASAYPDRNVISQGLGVGGPMSDDIKVDRVFGELGKSIHYYFAPTVLAANCPIMALRPFCPKTRKIKSEFVRVDRLIAAALKAGDKDNVTVIIVTAI